MDAQLWCRYAYITDDDIIIGTALLYVLEVITVHKCL